jgi:hypothetical protein
MSDIAGSAVPNYGGTVFVSYARADDERPPSFAPKICLLKPLPDSPQHL